MAQVLGMTAGESSDPMTVFVTMKGGNRDVALRLNGFVQAGPSV